MPPSSRKVAFFIEAEKLRLAENYEKAIPAYKAVLVEDPGDLEVRKTLAGLYLITGQRPQGLAEYMLLTSTYLQQGELDKAEQLLGRVRNLDKERRFRDKLESLARGIADARSAAAAPAVLAAPVAHAAAASPAPMAPPRTPIAAPAPRAASVPPLAAYELDEVADVTDDDLIAAEADLRQEALDLSRSSAALSNVLFQELPPPVLNQVIRACDKLSYERGATVFEQGSTSRDIHIVAQGIFEVRVKRNDGRVVGIAKLGPGDMFGEMGFLSGDPREATVIADSDGLCYRLPSAEADRLVNAHAELKRVAVRLYSERVVPLFLATSSLFQGVPGQVRDALLRSLEPMTVGAGQTIIQEGSQGDDLYFVKKGEVRVVTRGPKGQVELGRVGRHQLFGEISFFTQGPRTASVIAATPCELLRIAADHLRPIVAQHPPLLEALRQVQVKHATDAARKLVGK